ncbi:MAG: hypothetical protein ACYTG5_15310 [Planctomycetota bacterium]|jgi:hypothetical protein
MIARAICFSLALMLAACAAPSPVPHEDLRAQAASGQLEAKFDGDRLSLEIKGGAVPLQDFVLMAQEISGKAFVYKVADLKGAHVSFVGQVQLEPANFFSFFQTMLYLQGFACLPQGRGDDEFIKLVKMG